MNESLEKQLIALLQEALREPSTRRESIRRFQEIVWGTPENGVEDEVWALLGDLAVDLDYYEPNPRQQGQAPQFFGDKEVERILRAALQKLENAHL